MDQLHDLTGRLRLQEEISSASEKGLPRGIGPASMDDELLWTVPSLKNLHFRFLKIN
jgi:hypothetical protein